MSNKSTGNIGNLLTTTARLRGDSLGLAHGAQQWTWREIEQSANALAAALLDLGIKKGDRVAIQSKNSREMFESMYAITRTGAVYVPMSSHSSPFETCQMVDICGAVVILAESEFAENLAAVATECKSVRDFILIGDIPPTDFASAGVHHHASLIAARLDRPTVSVAVAPDDICWQNFTSGTTGVPKSGMNSHGTLNYSLLNVVATMMPGTDHHDATLAVAPIGHGTGTITTACTMVGAATIIPASQKMDVAECWDLIERYKVSILFTVPTILMRLLKHPSYALPRSASLKHVRCGAAPMTRAELDLSIHCLGDAFVRSYGAVEHVGAGTVYRPNRERIAESSVDNARDPLNSIGHARYGTQIGILDEDMNELPIGELGEMCLRSSGIFDGYYNNPEADAASFAKGWFRTGDLGRLDERGFVYLEGRRKEMFKSGGLQISPNEVQNQLTQHPAVDEAHLVNVPDSDFGEVGVAVVRLKPEQQASERELIDFIRSRLAHYKQPRRIFIVDDIPRTAHGKVPKQMVRDFLYTNGHLQPGQDVAKFGAHQ